MHALDEQVIELSKTKLLLLVVGAGVFVALGLGLLQMDAASIEANRRFNSPWLVHGLGLVCVLFFGLCGVFAARKLFFDKAPGLVLNARGLFDNSSGVAAGWIPWSEILGFAVFELQKQKSLVILVRDPQKYIEAGHPMKRALNRMNFKLCGSPIAISANTLKIDFDALKSLGERYLAKYGAA